MLVETAMIAHQWHAVKSQLEIVTGLDRDSMHIYAAIGIQMIAAIVTRRSLGRLLPWFAVLLLLALNELIDVAQFAQKDHVPENYWPGAILDVWNTMLLPTVMLLAVRFGPRHIFRKPN